jgi:hypothetical protein
MHVPCPIPLAEPWSPVGYEVVQLSEETVPVGAEPASPGESVSLAPGRDPAALLPSSPVGYRVSLVATEQLPPRPDHLGLGDAPVSWRPRRRVPSIQRARPDLAGSRLGLWMPLAAGAVMLAVPLLVCAVTVGSRPAARGQRAAGAGAAVALVPAAIQVPADDPPEAQRQALLVPLAARPDNAEPCGQGAAANDADADPLRPAPRQTFQTAVEFARNPREAARIAGDEQKLTLILHVAGDFDDPGFT